MLICFFLSNSGKRRITISTSGVVPIIHEVCKNKICPRLSRSRLEFFASIATSVMFRLWFHGCIGLHSHPFPLFVVFSFAIKLGFSLSCSYVPLSILSYLYNFHKYNSTLFRFLSHTIVVSHHHHQVGDELDVNLAISLHACRDDLRNELVPINKTYPLRALMEGADKNWYICNLWYSYAHSNRENKYLVWVLWLLANIFSTRGLFFSCFHFCWESFLAQFFLTNVALIACFLFYTLHVFHMLIRITTASIRRLYFSLYTSHAMLHLYWHSLPFAHGQWHTPQGHLWVCDARRCQRFRCVGVWEIEGPVGNTA